MPSNTWSWEFMPKLESIRIKLDSQLPHDTLPEACTACSNRIETVNELGKKLLQCGLYRALTSDRVKDIPKNITDAAGDVLVPIPEPLPLTRTAMARIFSGEFFEVSAQDLTRAYYKSDLAEAKGASVLKTLQSDEVLPGDTLVFLGDQTKHEEVLRASTRGYGGCSIWQAQVVKGSLISKIESASDNCPVIEEIIGELSSRYGGPDSVLSGPKDPVSTRRDPIIC